MNKKKLIIILAIFILAAVAGGTYYFRIKQASGEGETLVSSYTLEKKDIEEIVKSKGKVAAKEIKKIYVATSQKISKVNYKVGDFIHKGDVLIEFDVSSRNTLQREIDILELDLDNEKLNLKILKQPLNNIDVLAKEKEIKEIETQIISLAEELQLLEFQLKNINTKYQREQNSYVSKEKLFELGGISKLELEKADYEKMSLEDEFNSKQSLIKNKKIEIQNAKENLNYEKKNYLVMLNDKIQEEVKRESNIKISKNNIKKYKIQLDEKRSNLEKLKKNIISTFDGSILSQIAEKNMLVDTEKALMELADTSSKIIETNIATYNISKVNIGDKVKIKVETGDEEFYEGKVSKIQNIASASQGDGYSENVVAVEIAILEKDKKFDLKPGYDVNLEIVTDKKENTFVVPALSIVYDGDKKYIYKIEENVAKKIEVKTGIESINEVELLLENAELSEEDSIVENPSLELSDNDPVLIGDEEEVL